MPNDQYIKTGNCFINKDYTQLFKDLNLDSMDKVFDFHSGTKLEKPTLQKFRTRICFTADTQQGTEQTFYLKRYQNPPATLQLRNWLDHRARKTTAEYDMGPIQELTKANIQTPTIVAYGIELSGLFEKRSFVITLGLQAQSMEKSLPQYVKAPKNREQYNKRKQFILDLADFVRRFHNTGYRHRDLYLCHIFHSEETGFHLIDLNRVFKPMIFASRFTIKDLAQLHYSSPGNIFTDTDRLRFYLQYAKKQKLSRFDKFFTKQIRFKAWKIAEHDIRHGRTVPFAN